MPGKSKSTSVARRWEKVVASSESSYKTAKIDPRKIRFLRESVYVLSVANRTKPGAICMEAGCGSGSLSLALASTGRKVVACDISIPLLKNLCSNRDAVSLTYEKAKEIFPARGDLERLPFADNSFDAVFNEGVIEHWTERASRLEVLKELIRVVKPGGHLVVFVPNGRHPLYYWWQLTRYPGYASEADVPWHRFRSKELATELTEVGLTDVEHDGISPWSTLGLWPNWLPFRGLAYLCRRVFPEPLWMRRRFGFNLMAAGRKPGAGS